MVNYVKYPLEIPVGKYIDTVVDERKGGRHQKYFKEIKEAWKSCCENYIRAHGDPSILGESIILVEEEKLRFVNLYSADNKFHHAKIIGDCRAFWRKKINICPACGEMGTPNTLDHYLPKTVYPEFSIFLLNLTPMCDICQGAKGAKYINENGDPIYIHNYYQCEDVSILKLIISGNLLLPDFELKVEDDLEPGLSSLVKRHSEGLNIPVRFTDFCVGEYGNLLDQARLSRDEGVDPISEIDRTRRLEEKKHLNSWEAIFYRSVCNNNELIYFLRFADLPKF